MAQRQNNPLRAFFRSRWFLLTSAVVLLFFGVAFGRAYYQNYQVDQEIKRLQGEVARLQAKKLETLEMLNYVKSPSYVDAQARAGLNLSAPGEHVAIIAGTNLAVAATGQPAPKGVESGQISNAHKWWNYFFAPAQ